MGIVLSKIRYTALTISNGTLYDYWRNHRNHRFFLLLPFASFAQQKLTEEQQEYQQWATKIWNSLDRKSSRLKLDGAVATLNVPETFYYLWTKDSNTVLEEV